MTAYLIDTVFGYGVWAILIFIVYALTKLIKREKIKTMNFKLVFLVSLVGIIPSTFNLLDGKYKDSSQTKISEPDKLILQGIIQSCLSGEEITKSTHVQFYTLVDKYKMKQSDLDEFFALFYSDDLILLQKSFYKDALATIQTGKIVESKERLNLENKLMTQAQKERNNDYLKKILSKEPIEVSGEMVVIDIEICLKILDNIDNIYQVATTNINTLKNRNAFD